jgi:hypothetical protein
MLLFNPDTYGDLRNEYPELDTIPEFSSDKLSTKEMVFVWCMGNRTSPFWEEIVNYKKGERVTKKATKEQRITYCLRFSKLNIVLSEKDRQEWMSGKFPDNIMDAIARMENFRPDIRTKARIIAEHAFQIAWQQSHNRETTVEEQVKIVQNLPILINSVEQGYGFKAEKRSKSKQQKGKAGMTLMDMAMREDSE